MNDIQNIFSVVLQILNKPFVIFGVRLNMTGVIIGGALISLVAYFIFGLFDND